MTKKIPFNLEQALANREQVVCRNGKKPSEWHYFKTKKDNQLCICHCADGSVRWVDVKGLYCSEPLGIDLLLEVEGTVWFNNIFRNKTGERKYKSLEDTFNGHSFDVIAIQKTTIIDNKVTIEIVHTY